MRESTKRVLILTGGLINPKNNSVVSVLKKQFMQTKHSQQQWLDIKIKALFAEPILAIAKQKKKAPVVLRDFLSREDNFSTAELTEVSIASLLAKEGIEYELANYDELFESPKLLAEKLDRCGVLMLSTTFLRDLGELMPLLQKLKTPRHRVVVGGALMGILKTDWEGHPDIDVVAVGYGEFLIPQIATWIKSEFKDLKAPATGHMKQAQSLFLFSGSPADKSLDFIQKPDWRRSENDHQKSFKMISYESVRGCPYRCSFCNYPYLFDDTVFRMKSAKKMAQDWLEYAQETGVEYITCLDSLFTLPKSRLIDFCNELIRQSNRLKWICYARADDLADEDVVKLMVAAGAIQVQIGLESGDQRILNNMNKKTTVEMNAQAILNCRKHGLTTVATLIVGYPGETKESLNNTFSQLKLAPPDFFFLATFSTRVTNVPILSKVNRHRFGLMTSDNQFTSSPYWQHDTMSCLEAVNHARWLFREMIQNKVSIDALSFYKNILSYTPELREPLLELQHKAIFKTGLFTWIHRLIDVFLAKDIQAVLGDQRPSSSTINASSSALGAFSSVNRGPPHIEI